MLNESVSANALAGFSMGQIMDDDAVIQQKSWQLVRRLNSRSDELLDAPALVGGSRTYTYRQMFRMWDRYAEVFSALGMTGANHARVVVFGSWSVEPLIAIYALNMCGTSVSLTDVEGLFDTKKLEQLIVGEGITDVVVPDFLMPMDFFRHFMSLKERLGLRNVVVLCTNLAGPFTPRIVIPLVRMQREAVRGMPGAQLMDELLVRHAGHPISYGTELEEDAFITHTSGTTKGIRKPVPLSDAGLNEAARRVLRREEWSFVHNNLRTHLTMHPGAAYGLVDMVHLPLVAGGTLVTLFWDCLNPYLPEAFKYYDLNVIMTTPFVLDALDACQADFSSVEIAFVGGAYVSSAAKRHYDDIMKRGGAREGIAIGYGLSEVGGACIVASGDRTDDAMGYPLPGVRVKIFDEDEETYHDLSEGPRTGVLFINSPSVSSGRIDDTTYFEIDEIDGEPYLNTFDLVRVNEDGSLTHVGRMNRYFVNNDGVRFDAGLVEGALSAQPYIRACAVAPQYDKTISDTVPVLYMQLDDQSQANEDAVRDALVRVFVDDAAFTQTNLPDKCVIVDKIPRNAAGKVDVYALRSIDKSKLFQILPIYRDERLVDVKLESSHDTVFMKAGTPDELDETMMGYVEMVLWYIPGAHAWYTTGDKKQRSKVLKRGVTIMTQFAQQMNQPNPPQGMSLPMAQPPCAPGFAPVAAAMPQAMPMPMPMPMAQPIPQMLFVPCAQPMPQMPMPVPLPMPQTGTAQSQFPSMPSFLCPMNGAKDQQGVQAPFGQAQQGGQPAFVTAQQGVQIPFGPAQQGVQPPFGAAPQPYELYENALKNAIKFLQDLLAQSEAARTAAGSQADPGAESEQADAAAQPAAFMPGFGCQQMPMPNQATQQAPGIGVMPANNYLGNLFASLFGASNTDYFYED